MQSGAWNTSRRAVEETPSPSITAKTRRAVRSAAFTVTVTAEARRHRWSPTLCPDVLSRFRNTLMPDSKYVRCSFISSMPWNDIFVYAHTGISIVWQLMLLSPRLQLITPWPNGYHTFDLGIWGWKPALCLAQQDRISLMLQSFTRTCKCASSCSSIHLLDKQNKSRSI